MRISKKIFGLIPLFVGWTMFQMAPQHSGFHPGVNFGSEKFSIAWKFTLRKHIWKYMQGVSVWSSQLVSGNVNDRTLIFAGSYDKCVYALDALTGKEEWRYITGAAVQATPCFAKLKDRDFLFVGSNDRTLYALNAGTGEKIWSYEFYPWKDSVSQALISSPCFVKAKNRNYIFVGVWVNDRRSFRTVQIGEVLCLVPESGKLLWRKSFGHGFITSPAFSYIEDKPVIIVSSNNGIIFCLDAVSGDIIWRRSLSEKLSASVSISGKMCFISDDYGMVYALNVNDGRVIWQTHLGNFINSTAAHYENYLFVGCFNRYLYCLDTMSGKKIWSFKTGKHVAVSPVICSIKGNPCVIFSSMDDHLYLLDAKTGKEIWKYKAGSMLWHYEKKGISLHSSSSLVATSNGGLLIFPCYDGTVYAFKSE